MEHYYLLSGSHGVSLQAMFILLFKLNFLSQLNLYIYIYIYIYNMLSP